MFGDCWRIRRIFSILRALPEVSTLVGSPKSFTIVQACPNSWANRLTLILLVRPSEWRISYEFASNHQTLESHISNCANLMLYTRTVERKPYLPLVRSASIWV